MSPTARVSARRRRQAAAVGRSLPGEMNLPASHREVVERIRAEARAHVLAYGLRRAEAILVVKWRADRRAVRAGADPRHLAYALSVQAARTAAPATPASARTRMPRCTRRRPARRSALPPSTAETDDHAAQHPETQPTRSPRRKVKGPSRMDTTLREVRRG